MKTLLITLLSALPCVFAAALPEGDTLASNTIVATFTGTKDKPCMHRTSLCPDRCNHALTLALFTVDKNEKYEKPGEYGDDKLEAGSTAMVDIKRPVAGQETSVVEDIKALKPGDKVRLTITHHYVNENGNRYPIRPVTQFEKL